MDDRLIARQGDVLVVSYPEVKIPVARFNIVSVGGLSYSRQMNKGDSVEQEYDRIYAFLRGTAERDARQKVKLWAEELSGSRPKPPPIVPPKPAPLGGGRP
jgi:hypothetical protein